MKLKKSKAEIWGSVFDRWREMLAFIQVGLLLIIVSQMLKIPRQQANLAESWDSLERVEATITAYTSLPELTDDTPLIMASGKEVYWGAAACPRKYPFGTVIKGLGEDLVCEDRMNRRYTDEMEHFDVWMPTLKDAKDFGRHKVVLYIKN